MKSQFDKIPGNLPACGNTGDKIVDGLQKNIQSIDDRLTDVKVSIQSIQEELNEPKVNKNEQQRSNESKAIDDKQTAEDVNEQNIDIAPERRSTPRKKKKEASYEESSKTSVNSHVILVMDSKTIY